MLRRLSWVALRQTQAVRESIEFTLRGSAIALDAGSSETEKVAWLKRQGVEPCYYRIMPEDRLELTLEETLKNAVEQYGVNMQRVQVAGTYSRFDEEDVGWERSSTGWNRLPNFITTSALIRILGAMEQYELDVLKTLLHYRPAGSQSKSELDFIDADLSVATEPPDADNRFAKPALWSWLRKPAENAVERRRLYKSVFGIDLFPKKFGSLTSSQIKAYYQEIYEQRNALAHGRSSVTVTLGDYYRAEAFVLSLVLHLSSVCKERYALGV